MDFSAEAPGSAVVTVDPAELVELCAVDHQLFAQTFFPQAARLTFPPMLQDIWELLDDPQHRHVAVKMFRGSGKTTTLRLFMAKRVAYAVSRTIMIVSAAQAHAVRTVSWLQGRIERGGKFPETFGLKPSTKKWSESWITIEHEVAGCEINVVAVGMEGQLRGLNIDDYRPDLILVDDPNDEENTATEEQRAKTSGRMFGAIDKSLTPRSENPNAKLVLLQTPFCEGDLIEQACKDEAFAHRAYSCFDEDGESRWPERFPTAELLEDKRRHEQRNEMAVWYREMEVTPIADALTDFKPEWLKYWYTIEREATFPTFGWIDPVPKPSPAQVAKGLRGKDFEAFAIVGLYRGAYFVLESVAHHGHEPDWTVAQFLMLTRKWRPLMFGVESTGYQSTLAWLLNETMKRQRVWTQIREVDDRRSKRHRIVQGLKQVAYEGKLFFHPSQTSLQQQFVKYPMVDHDDEIEAVANAVSLAKEYELAEAGEQDTLSFLGELGRPEKAIEAWRAAP